MEQTMCGDCYVCVCMSSNKTTSFLLYYPTTPNLFWPIFPTPQSEVPRRINMLSACGILGTMEVSEQFRAGGGCVLVDPDRTVFSQDMNIILDISTKF